ncbi:MAG: hypothetical protein IPI97_14575 [Nitrosomonas sp.]|nr:hypothetical protein [Nitrosomonas sp.]
MSQNLPQHYVQQYATNIQLLLQQKGSRLKGTVMTGSHVGEQASPVDQIGKIEMQSPAGRFAPIGRVDAPLDRRWVFPEDKDLPQLIDHFDKLRLLTDPQSSYVQNAIHAAGRHYDRQILAALNGTAKTGKSGATSVALPAAQKIAVSFGAASDVGLTVKKLREAKKKLMAADVDVESDPLYCIVNAAQHDSLLAEAQVVSTDFNDKPVLVEGKVMRFLGINFIHTELVESAAGDNLIPVYAKSGIYLGMWSDMQTDISQRKDLSGHPWQAYLKLTSGATRLEEAKVVQIACNV